MAGGLLNLISTSSNNVFLTGNPTKTFFKCAYSKYTNFGLQKFRLDFDGTRDIRLTTDSTFTFKIKRYADLLMDTYLVITLPHIYSPIHHPCQENNYQWVPYEFRWIKNIGIQMIRNIEIKCGSLQIQKFSGEYLAAMIERDFSKEKKDLINRMTGNTNDFTNPAVSELRSNTNIYPSCYYTSNPLGAEPSIRGRQLYIPINTWFSLDSKCAFPLISLQYNELEISVTLRPIQELFQVRDVFDHVNNFPYVQPDFNSERFAMYKFLQSPPSERITSNVYKTNLQTWNADVHLLATYGFLSNDESILFAKEDQVYLVKDIVQYKFLNITGSKKVEIPTNSMVSNWMFFFQRNDVNMRNEWSNYSNFPYFSLPSNLIHAPRDISPNVNVGVTDLSSILKYGPAANPNNTNTGLYITGDFSADNKQEILETMGIVIDGNYRENIMPSGVFNYVEKCVRTNGGAPDGLYCYNFCLNTSPFVYQPSGAINMSKFKTIELEFTTYVPPFDLEGSNFEVVCNTTGVPIGISNKPNWKLYNYNFNLTLFEERHNILSFINGNAGMMYAK